MAPHHHESSRWIPAPPRDVFAFVDDHSRFSSHMSESSWMMGGGHMTVETDDANGQAVGSHIRLGGRVFGLRLFLDEVVIRREPPVLKIWETVGTPRLLVIGRYAMGVHITPGGAGSDLTVFIDYELPNRWPLSWVGRLFGGMYARWCVEQMLSGSSRHFDSAQAVAA